MDVLKIFMPEKEKPRPSTCIFVCFSCLRVDALYFVERGTMVTRGSVLFFCFCLFVVCFAQTRPSIPSTFYARVRVNLLSGPNHHKDSWIGGGIYALDVKTGYKRVQFNLDAESFEVPAQIHYHALDRYDMGSTYSIDYSRMCTVESVNGRLETPFKWVENATFAGESEYLGFTLENWEYTDASKVHYKISVKKGTNDPLVFTTGNQIVTDKDAMLEMTVLEWHNTIRPEIRSYIPSTCQGYDILQGSVSEVVQFADANWDCADPACSSTVPSGSGQPDYGCAEFVARSLAAGGFIPGLGPLDSQSAFGGWSYDGNTYDLLYCSNLSDALSVLGFSKMPNQASSVTAGCGAFGDGGDGYFSHAVIGVAPGVDDAHNNARFHWQVSGSLYNGIDAVWCPPGSPSSGTTGGTTTTSSTGYSSGSFNEADVLFDLGGGKGSIFDVKPKSGESNEMRLVEERAERKFDKYE